MGVRAHAFDTDIMKELAPVGLLEECYADRAAICMWRLRRVPRIESEMFRCERRDAIKDFAAYQKQEARNQMEMWPHHESRIGSANSREEAHKEGNRMLAHGRSLLKNYNRNLRKEVGNSAAVFRRLSGGQDLIARLSRYEADLERMLFRALAALHQLQAQRCETIVEAPATVEKLAHTSQAADSQGRRGGDVIEVPATVGTSIEASPTADPLPQHHGTIVEVPPTAERSADISQAADSPADQDKDAVRSDAGEIAAVGPSADSVGHG